MDDHEIELRLRWRHTWEDGGDDYVAEASGSGFDGPVGRIYRHEHGTKQSQWTWSMTAHGAEVSRNFGPLHGEEPTPRRAAYEVERAWSKAIEGTSLARPETMVNAYAAAKGRG